MDESFSHAHHPALQTEMPTRRPNERHNMIFHLINDNLMRSGGNKILFLSTSV